MTHNYNITGMTCDNCLGKVKNEILKLSEVTGAQVQLNSPQATIHMQKHIPVETLQSAISKAGNYKIAESGKYMDLSGVLDEPATWLKTYKPLLLIGGY